MSWSATERATLRNYWLKFRNDLEGYVAYEVVEACIGCYFEMAPARSTSYYAFTDPESAAATIVHARHQPPSNHRRIDGRVVIDCIREFRPPFSPEQVIIDLVSVLKTTASTASAATAMVASFRASNSTSAV